MTILKRGKFIGRRAGALTLAIAILAFAAAAISPIAAAQEDGSALAAPIEGTWIFHIHRVAQNLTFTAMQSFTAGGVSVATGTIDRTPPPPISPLYGSWRRVDDNRYATTISFFVFDPAGNAVAMIKNNETFQLTDSDDLVGTGQAYVCDVNGNHCVNANSPLTITGKRVVAQGS